MNDISRQPLTSVHMSSNLIEIQQQQQPFVVQKGNVLEIVPTNDAQLSNTLQQNNKELTGPIDNETQKHLDKCKQIDKQEINIKNNTDTTKSNSVDKLNGIILSRNEIERRQIQQDELLLKRKQENDKRKLERMLRKERLRQDIKHILETNPELWEKLENYIYNNDNCTDEQINFVYDPNAVCGRSCLRKTKLR